MGGGESGKGRGGEEKRGGEESCKKKARSREKERDLQEGGKVPKSMDWDSKDVAYEEKGHLMGKKSTGESSVSERGSLKQQLREYIRWEEAASNLLGLIEAKENRNHQPPQPKALGNQQPSWDSEDSSNFKDVGSKGKDSLLQVLNVKEGTPQLNQQ
nr:gastrin-releasing peptide isoform X4 [Macaca fascicularis]